MKKKTALGILVLVALVACVFFLYSNASIENRFFAYERDFQQAADAFMLEEKFTGTKRWLEARGPSEGGQYLPFHMGDDYVHDFYDPRIVYIHSDDSSGVSLCSFDGQMIKKIKARWYICKESRF